MNGPSRAAGGPATAAGGPMIVARGLTKRFGATVAVDRLDLEVPEGTTFGLVGPDGAGKTTAIRLLATVLPPDAGQAFIGGLDAAREAEAIKQMVGYVPQRFSLYGDLTVAENIAFVAQAFGVPPAEAARRGREWLRFIGLEPFSGRLAEKLSGGMKQKLALACCLVHEPRVLYLDEPTTGVDPVARRDFWTALADLRDRGATILVSTPYMDEATRCDRIGFLHAGRLLDAGAPAQLVARFPGELWRIPTPAAHPARAACAGLPGVREVTIHGDSLHLAIDPQPGATTPQPGAPHPAAASPPPVAGAVERLRAAGIEHGEPERIEPSLEDVFVDLVRRSRAGAGRAGAGRAGAGVGAA